MRLRIGLALIALVLVGTAGATTLARSPEPRTLVLRSTVRELTADRTRAAVLLGRRETCAALIWTPGTGQRAPLSGRCSGSGRDSSYGIALTGSRAAWIQTSGDNVLEMNLMTSTGSDRRARIVLLVYSGPGDGGDSIGEVRGDGGAHFFTVVRRCEAPEPDSQPGPFACPPGRSSGDVIGTDVWAYYQARAGARCPGETLSERCRLVTSAPERLTLLGADRGRLAIRLQGGPVEIRSVAGARLATISLSREHSQTALFGDGSSCAGKSRWRSTGRPRPRSPARFAHRRGHAWSTPKAGWQFSSVGEPSTSSGSPTAAPSGSAFRGAAFHTPSSNRPASSIRTR